MPKIIFEGPDPEVSKTVACRECGCVLAYEDREVKRATWFDHHNERRSRLDIKCPNCLHAVLVDSF